MCRKIRCDRESWKVFGFRPEWTKQGHSSEVSTRCVYVTMCVCAASHVRMQSVLQLSIIFGPSSAVYIYLCVQQVCRDVRSSAYVYLAFQTRSWCMYTYACTMMRSIRSNACMRVSGECLSVDCGIAAWPRARVLRQARDRWCIVSTQCITVSLSVV